MFFIAELIEKAQMRFGFEQQLMVVLAVQIDEKISQIAQCGVVGQLSVDANAITSVT